jgi:hypothetical protein
VRLAAPLIQRSDDPRRDWKRINQDSLAIGDLRREVQLLRRKVERYEQGHVLIERLPFEVYSSPPPLLAEEDRDPLDGWRKFRVRSGRADYVPCLDCDGADGEGGTPLVIEVPINTPIFHVWCDYTDATEPHIKHTTFPIVEGSPTATHWDTFPALPAGIRPLALINTQTHAARKRAIVRQYQIGDIWPSGGADGGTWT